MSLADEPGARLDDLLRRGLARRARAYIADLVADHHGDADDVRSIIDHLHAEVVRADRADP
jgi:hypothetical protein